MNSNKIILDLCGGTGAWSKPYKEAGYDVRVITLPDFNVKNFEYTDRHIIFSGKKKNMRIDKSKVYGILSAPPCTMFSLARTTARTPRNLQTGMDAVRACTRIIWRIHPKFWVMENPKDLLRQFMGKPAFEFDASEFGEDYNKHTDLWGYFKEPKKRNNYTRFPSTDKNTRKLPPIPADYIIDKNMSNIAIRRSITPQGFAQAFFKANK